MRMSSSQTIIDASRNSVCSIDFAVITQIAYLKMKRKKINSTYMYKCSIMTTPHASKMITDSIKCIMIRLLVPMGNIS
jgi:hypothetical protein